MSKPTTASVLAFLPDALAIRHALLPGWARWGIWWLSGILLLALSMACLFKVDIIVQTQGKLVSDNPNIVIRPLERSVIKAVKVKVGDRVEKGQVLITFDPVFNTSDQERLSAEVRIQQARLERLQAEFTEVDYVPGSSPTAEQKVQKELFDDRKQFYAERETYFSNELARIKGTQHSLQENLRIQLERLKGYQAIEDMMSKGRSAQATSLRDIIESQIARQGLQAEIKDKQNNLKILENEHLSKKAEYQAFLSNWRIEIAEEMVKTQAALISAQKELLKATQLSSYVELRAPEAAYVHEIAPVSPGSAVRETEALITLVPSQGTLECEARVRAEDIGRVHTGDQVRLKLSAFPYQKYGTLHGKVRLISRDAFQHDPTGENKEATPAFYQARVAITGCEMPQSNLESRLIPGMEVQADIVTGKRRIINYLLFPLIRSLDEAIREP
ncbi:MAG: HlyD family type I secretion periplasmic adaptor subunit [Desulfovibrionaceae bacterium]|nr:HlyD family type I secretion periplasmic adaptor subunit [Desulfovibrionaceae bacterium]